MIFKIMKCVNIATKIHGIVTEILMYSIIFLKILPKFNHHILKEEKMLLLL